MKCSITGHWSPATGFWCLVIVVLLLALPGCGGPRLYPIQGKVTWENGDEARELAGGLVICESVEGGVGARGDIEQDGSFQLSTYKPGDGVLPGKHRVAVVEYSPREPPPPPKIDRTFSNIESSGLEISVDRGTKDLTLKVRRARSAADAKKTKGDGKKGDGKKGDGKKGDGKKGKAKGEPTGAAGKRTRDILVARAPRRLSLT